MIDNIGNKIILVLIIFLFGCDLPTQPAKKPKEISDTKFKSGLNILGIIMLNNPHAESFVYIEQALPVDKYSNDSCIVDNADVNVWGESDTTNYNFTKNNSRYTNKSFISSENEIYNLEIEAVTNQGTLSVSGQTKVPSKSKISRDSIKITDNSLEVSLDNSYERYDFVLYSKNNSVICNKILYKNKDTIDLDFEPTNSSPTKLEIFSYDKNLAKYLKKSDGLPIQTYRETLSTFDEGYGCFGAISVKSIVIDK